MADPVTAAAAGGSMVLDIFSGITKANAQKEEGKAKQQMYLYQSGISAMNKTVADQNRDYALRVGDMQSQVEGYKTKQAVGTAIASRGASGLDVNKGSNARVVQSVETVGEQNEAVIRSDAARRAYGYEVEGRNATAQGEVYRMAGADARRAGDVNAMSTYLSTASSVAGKWSDASTRGMFS